MAQLKKNMLSLMVTLLSLQYVTSAELPNENQNKNNEIFSIPMLYLTKIMKEPLKWYSDNFPNVYNDLMKPFVSFINKGDDTDCAKIFYITEGNLLEILVRELLNNMHLNKEFIKSNNEVDSCNEIQNWLEYLTNTMKSKFCSNIYVNYKLFDIISVLCKQTNRQVKTSIENVKDLMKSQHQLKLECIIAIENGDFKNGERKLKMINDENTEFIINKIYNNNEENFEKVLTFFSNIGNIRKSFIAYKFLYESLENSIESEGWKLYKLFENLNKIHNCKTYPNIEASMAAMRSSLKNRLTLFIGEELLNSYEDSSSPVLPESYILADIYRNFKDLYIDGVKLFLHQLCKNNTCNATNLMEFARRRNFHGEIILVLKSIFDELNLSDEEKLMLGHHVYYISNINYTSSQKDKLEGLKENLPTSIKHLLFSKYVCVRNIAYNEHLMADCMVATPTTNYTNTKDNLPYTSYTVYRPVNAIWTFDRIADHTHPIQTKYRIRNILCNQTLFATQSFDYNYQSDNRKISLKCLNDTVGHSVWQIEPIGDNVYIKNTAHNTYMYINDDFYDVNKRITYTWITNHSKINSKNFQWLIEDCSESNLRTFT